MIDDTEVDIWRRVILRDAVKEYKKALRRHNDYEARKLEAFFLSTWGQLLSSNNGQYIIEHCQKLVATERNE